MDFTKTQELLTLHEGISHHVYQDSRGIWTIGIGRNVDKKYQGSGLREDEMELMLQNDILNSVLKLQGLSIRFDNLSDVRQAVLVDMCHNLGIYGILRFKEMFYNIGKGNWDGAAQEMLDSLWAKQVGQRAIRLSKMMATDQWPEEIEST